MEQDRENPFDLVHARFLSDTVDLAFAIKEFAKSRHGDVPGVGEPVYTQSTKALAVHVACSLASLMVASAARTNPALAYRGCVSCGDFEVHDNFLVGPAVDEAAASIDLAQGAYIWLLPSAIDVFMEFGEGMRSRDQNAVTLPYLPCKVPLKGGDEFCTYAVSPVALARTEGERDEIQSRIMDTFVRGLEVHIKKQNTLRFLDACIEDWKSPIIHRARSRKGTRCPRPASPVVGWPILCPIVGGCSILPWST
jgi:hypothetical protein